MSATLTPEALRTLAAGHERLADSHDTLAARERALAASLREAADLVERGPVETITKRADQLRPGDRFRTPNGAGFVEVARVCPDRSMGFDTLVMPASGGPAIRLHDGATVEVVVVDRVDDDRRTWDADLMDQLELSVEAAKQARRARDAEKAGAS